MQALVGNFLHRLKWNNYVDDDFEVLKVDLLVGTDVNLFRVKNNRCHYFLQVLQVGYFLHC